MVPAFQLIADWGASWFAPLAAFFIFFVMGIVIRTVAVSVLTPIIDNGAHELPKAVLKNTKEFIPVWFTLVGLGVASHLITLTPNIYDILDKAVVVLLIFSMAFPAARIVSSLLLHIGGQVERMAPISGMLNWIIQVVIWVIAIVLVLNYLGVAGYATPALTTMGLGGLAVALAFQDTFANFFAGFYILADRPVRVGDFIKLDSGSEGYVVDVGWRSSHIRTLSNNMIVVPNQKLAQSVITNYSMPETKIAASIMVRTDYDVDPQKIEETLLDIAYGAIGEVTGLVSEPPPAVRLSPGFGDYGLEFSLLFHVNEFTDQYLVQHELRKRVLIRFRQEGIRMPFLSTPSDGLWNNPIALPHEDTPRSK